MNTLFSEDRKYGSFLITFMMGVLAHIMVLTNRILSEDDYVNLVRNWGDGISLGRVLRPLFQIGSGSKYIINSVSGVVGLLFFSATIELIFLVLKVNSITTKLLIAAIFIMSPCAFSTMVFPVATGANFISLFLAFLALYLMVEKTESFFASKALPPILLIISMMVYQVYATIIIVAYLTKILVDYLIEKKSIIQKNNIINLGLMIVSIIGYVILYKLVFFIFHIQPADYQGFSKAGPRMNLGSLISAFVKSCQGFHGFWMGQHFGVYSVLNIAFWVLLIAVIVRNIVNSDKRVQTALWSILLLFAMAEACFMLYLTSSKMYYHNLMTWGCCFFYVLLVILEEKENFSIMRSLSYAVLIIICIYNYQNGNIGYHQLDIAREKTDYMVQNIMREIDSISDGTEKIAIVGDMGSFDNEVIYETNPVITGADEKVKILAPDRFEYYTRTVYGKNSEVVDEEELEDISKVILLDRETYKDAYPYGEYCFKYNDYIVVNYGQ